MSTHKEQWIADVMASIDNVQRLDVNEGLFTAIEDRLTSGTSSQIVSPRKIMLAAASFIGLLTLNFWVLSHFAAPKQSADMNNVVETYHLNPIDDWSSTYTLK